MSKRGIEIGLFVLVGLILFLSASAFAMDSVSITVTIRIEPFQQLTMRPKDDVVTVEGGNEKVTSKVRLEKVNRSEVKLEPAVSAGVESNVGWRLLAHTEDPYVMNNGTSNYSSGPELSLKIPESPSSVNPSGGSRASYVPIGSTQKEIATGGAGTNESFDIYYKLGFQGFDTDEVDGAGVNVVYTMMEL